jgi:hypothetical protein
LKFIITNTTLDNYKRAFNIKLCGLSHVWVEIFPLKNTDVGDYYHWERTTAGKNVHIIKYSKCYCGGGNEVQLISSGIYELTQLLQFNTSVGAAGLLNGINCSTLANERAEAGDSNNPPFLVVGENVYFQRNTK